MKRKILLIIFTLSVLLLPLNIRAASTSDAKESVSLSESCTLSLEYSSTETNLHSINIDLYKVASVSESYVFSLVNDFEATGIVINGITSQNEWNSVRTTIESYIYANNINPVANTLTDTSGTAIFTSISPGLYFIPAQSVTVDGFRYYFKSVLISLPDIDENGNCIYSVSAKPKPDVRPPHSSDLEFRVTKLWKGDGAIKRPAEVEVDLIRNGEVVRTITLSSANVWSYSWNAEDDGSIWTVAEKNIAEGYKVTVENNYTYFTIVNSYNNPPDEPPPTGDSTNTLTYVIVMCVVGAVLLLVGSTKRRMTEE